MISVRTGVAIAIVLSIAALAVGVAALMQDVRGGGPTHGRLVQTRITNTLSGDPVRFALDRFYMSPEGNGHVVALYEYPPGFFGHTRGCPLVWQRDAVVVAGTTTYRGLFTDPCSGAHFDRSGKLVDGPADRDLDRFPMTPEPDGMLVDTHTLLCGDNLPNAAAGVTPTPTPATPARCPRVSPDAP
ncbi:MAG: hypothetical protein ACYDEB_06295 [Dehalococcoidia bacterium]